MRTASRLRRCLVIITVLVVAFTLIGFLALPPFVKSQLEKRLSAELGRSVSVEKVRVNPYALSLTLESFAIKESDSSAVFVGWRRLYVNAAGLASLWKEWTLSRIELDGFASDIAVRPDGSFNFSDIIAKLSPRGAPPKAKGETVRPVRITSLYVSDARIRFSDASAQAPFTTTLGPVTFALTDFRTVSEQGAPYRFRAVTETGETLAWTGTVQAEPLRSAGEFNLEQITLAKYAPYYARHLQADLVDGKLAVKGRYEVSLAEGRRVAKVQGVGIQLRDLKVRERANQEMAVEIPHLDINGIEADALTSKGVIDSIAMVGGKLRARREKDGTLNLLSMLQSAPQPTAKTSPASAPPGGPPPKAPSPPDVLVKEIALRDLAVDVTDLAPPRPVHLQITRVAVELRNATLASGAQMPVELAFMVGAQGSVRLTGNVGISPLKADLKTETAGVEILPFSPYLEQAARVRLTQGTVKATLNTQALMTDQQTLAATVTGEVLVENFGLVDAQANEPLAGFTSLALKGLRASTGERLQVELEELNLAVPFARVILNKDKSLNVASVLPKQGSDSPSAPPTTPSANAPPTPAPPAPLIEVRKVVLSGGDFRFTDRSVEPNVTMAINQFGGTIAGLSSVNPKKADLNLNGRVDGVGPVAIVGKVDPLAASKFFDLKVDLKNVDLVPLSAYSGKFAGFALARGKLLLDVKLLMDGNTIDATNVITLNQLTFGEPVKSPEATTLPVRLGVALLKDTHGNIVIDVPIRGRTDDPSFAVGRVVLRVIVNLLTKAAVSPFSLLGAAFGGGGDELAFQEFLPGSPELNPAEVKKLETMVKALTHRPALSVSLQGSFDHAADTYALKRIKLADTVRQSVWAAKRTADSAAPPPEQLQITPDENNAMIKKLFDEKFPPGTEFGAPLPKPPVVATPPAPPPPGFIKRVVRVVTFKARREERAAQRETARAANATAQTLTVPAAAELPVEDMLGRLAEAVPVDDHDLRALAQTRAERVRDYFIMTGKIAGERMFLAKESAEAEKLRQGPRVFLNLQ